MSDPSDALPMSEAVDLDRLVLRDALDWFGQAHLPDAPPGEIERCRNVLLGDIAAQRAAEAARVREETLQAACKAQCLHCETGLPTERHDYWPFKHFHRHPEDQALTMECAAWRIRALREAPRG